MNIKIALYSYNGKGAAAEIEDVDGESVTLVKGMTYTGTKACRAAAKRLRDLADKFDKLADAGGHFSADLQEKINRGTA